MEREIVRKQNSWQFKGKTYASLFSLVAENFLPYFVDDKYLNELTHIFLEIREYTLNNIHKIPQYPTPLTPPQPEVVVEKIECRPLSRISIPGGVVAKKEFIGYALVEKEVRRFGYTHVWTETVTVKEPIYRITYLDYRWPEWYHRELEKHQSEVDKWYNEIKSNEELFIGLISLILELDGYQPGSKSWTNKMIALLYAFNKGTCSWEDQEYFAPEMFGKVVTEIKAKEG